MTRKSLFSAAAVAVGMMVATVCARSATVQAQAPALGTVQLTIGVMADGKALPAGSYSLRVSSDTVAPVTGQGPDRATWVEFAQDGQVKGRELASVVPAGDVRAVMADTPPAADAPKAERLKGGEYLRVWANHGGSHYLVHLVVAR